MALLLKSLPKFFGCLFKEMHIRCPDSRTKGNPRWTEREYGLSLQIAPQQGGQLDREQDEVRAAQMATYSKFNLI